MDVREEKSAAQASIDLASEFSSIFCPISLFFSFFFPFSSPIAVEFAMDQDGNLEKVGLVGPNIVGSSQGNCLY